MNRQLHLLLSIINFRNLLHAFKHNDFSAARDLHKANEDGAELKTFDGVFFTVNSPRKDIKTALEKKTPRKSLNGLLKPSSTTKGNSHSPSLMMKISQTEKILQAAVSIVSCNTKGCDAFLHKSVDDTSILY